MNSAIPYLQALANLTAHAQPPLRPADLSRSALLAQYHPDNAAMPAPCCKSAPAVASPATRAWPPCCKAMH
jgi:succinate dehydrogenase / fumarate reductase flavoprotein subunit/L-aspartate oxidase